MDSKLLNFSQTYDFDGGFRFRNDRRCGSQVSLHNLTRAQFDGMVDTFDPASKYDDVRLVDGQTGPFLAAHINMQGVEAVLYCRLTEQEAQDFRNDGQIDGQMTLDDEAEYRKGHTPKANDDFIPIES